MRERGGRQGHELPSATEGRESDGPPPPTSLATTSSTLTVPFHPSLPSPLFPMPLDAPLPLLNPPLMMLPFQSRLTSSRPVIFLPD